MAAETPGVLVADIEVAPLLPEGKGVANLSPTPRVDWKLRKIFLGIFFAAIALVLVPSFSQSLMKSKNIEFLSEDDVVQLRTYSAGSQQNGDHNMQVALGPCVVTKLPSEDAVKQLCTACSPDNEQNCEDVMGFDSLSNSERLAAEVKKQIKGWKIKIHGLCPNDGMPPDTPSDHDWVSDGAMMYLAPCTKHNGLPTFYVMSYVFIKDSKVGGISKPLPTDACPISGKCGRWMEVTDGGEKLMKKQMDKWKQMDK